MIDTANLLTILTEDTSSLHKNHDIYSTKFVLQWIPSRLWYFLPPKKERDVVYCSTVITIDICSQ